MWVMRPSPRQDLHWGTTLLSSPAMDGGLLSLCESFLQNLFEHDRLRPARCGPPESDARRLGSGGSDTRLILIMSGAFLFRLRELRQETRP